MGRKRVLGTDCSKQAPVYCSLSPKRGNQNTGEVFTPEERERLREGLVSAAYADAHITGAAVTGSAAVGREDRWSDIDSALCVAADADHGQVLADWTERMYSEHAAVHHLDVTRGVALCPACSFEHLPWPGMAGGVHDQQRAGPCSRSGMPASRCARCAGPGMNNVPLEMTAALAPALVSWLDVAELRRAFGVVSEALLVEIGRGNAGMGVYR